MTDIGDRVRTRLRASTSLDSQRALAAAVGMTTDALSRALNGERGFSIRELLAVAEQLETSVHWLATGESDPFELRVAARHGFDHDHRAHVDIDWTRSRPVLDDIGLAYEQVASALPARLPQRLSTDPSITREHLVETAGPDFVMDLAGAVERVLGIDVVRMNGIDGGYSLSVGGHSIIAISDTSNWFYQNWSIAHELGHFAAQSMGPVTAATQNVSKPEADANRYAAELLLPAAELRGIDWSSVSMTAVAELVWSRGVSTKALASRLDVLKIESGEIGWALRRNSTQKFLRQNLAARASDDGADLITARMQAAATRRFPLALLTAHRDGIEAGVVTAAMLAWMLDDDITAIEAELLPDAWRPEADVDELGAALGLLE